MVLNNMKKLIVTPQGEQLIDLTAEEIAQREQDAIQSEADKVIREQKIAQEKARKESAIAKLNALGLTQEEILSILK
jgi:DNA-binding transcriptional regulator YhcF (GntR family)